MRIHACGGSSNARAKLNRLISYTFDVCLLLFFIRCRITNSTPGIPKLFIPISKAEVEFSQKPFSSGCSTYLKYVHTFNTPLSIFNVFIYLEIFCWLCCY